ncbi:hypothetical protein PTKIN_Ptkin13bG0295600 [Pterospermum kingtungense]
MLVPLLEKENTACDYYQFDDLLSPEEKAFRKKVRERTETEVAPIMTEYLEKAEFPFEIVLKLGTLGIAGFTTKGYGCPGLSITNSAIANAEVDRVDASCSTFLLVHSVAMLTIGEIYEATVLSLHKHVGQRNRSRSFTLYGTVEEDRLLGRFFLSALTFLEIFSIFSSALTEPDFGSDASSVNTTARKVEGGWILKGQKWWIGNSTFADVLVIFARNTTTNQINGAVTFQAVNMTYLVFAMSWYLRERKQFGAPLAAFQLNQKKLALMLGNVQAMTLVGWRLCKLYEKGKMTPGHASLRKSWISLKTRETVALGRELLGGNGILADFLVAKKQSFLSFSIFWSPCRHSVIWNPYKGTYDINSLVTGREITGFASFKPAVMSKRSRF